MARARQVIYLLELVFILGYEIWCYIAFFSILVPHISVLSIVNSFILILFESFFLARGLSI